MEPEVQTAPVESTPAIEAQTPVFAQQKSTSSDFLANVFIGDDGLRPVWSIALVFSFMAVFAVIAGLSLFAWQHLSHATPGKHAGFTPVNAILQEAIMCFALYGGLIVSSLIERKKLSRYNFAGPKIGANFVIGTFIGFVTVSAMMASLYAGHWLNYGGIALSGSDVWKYALEWGIAFIGVGFFEEGAFRCFLQHQFARVFTFWHAFILLALICTPMIIFGKGNGQWGVYLLALAGLLPCLILHLKKSPHSKFWQAAWATSTLFGAIHTGNGGENWIGIFAAAAIGFVFCVTVYYTGSVWWAIGFHAAWDWGLTYFYGAADSGNPAVGHFLTTSPVGNELWSGGADGPEGSLLIIPLMLVLLLALYLVYGRNKSNAPIVAAELPAE